jgi:hypothetical protein
VVLEAKVVERGASCLTTKEGVGSRANVSNSAAAAEVRTDDGKLAAGNTTFGAVR